MPRNQKNKKGKQQQQQQQQHKKKSTNTSKEKEEKDQSWKLGVLFLLPPLVAFVFRDVVFSTSNTLQASREFRSRFSQVYVVPNFLPNETAIAWRKSMQQLWNQTLDRLDQEGTNNNSTPFLDGFTYATNNRGQLMGNFANAKVRSLQQIDQRRAVARQMKQQNQFAYSKWELDPAHPLLNEMEQTLTEPALLESVSSLIQTNYPQAQLDTSRQMSDIFATHYTQGDFLSTHNDGASGTWAVVVSLVEDDYDAAVHGGGLQFQCPERLDASERGEYCETLHPKFNTAVIFPTRVYFGERQENGPLHRVLDVTRPEGGRYAITGWWMDVKDILSKDSLLEREKMRGRK